MGGITIDSIVRIDMLDLIIFANIIYADSQSLTAILGLNAARHQSGQESALLCSAEGDYEGFLSFLRKMKRKMRRMSAS